MLVLGGRWSSVSSHNAYPVIHNCSSGHTHPSVVGLCRLRWNLAVDYARSCHGHGLHLIFVLRLDANSCSVRDPVDLRSWTSLGSCVLSRTVRNLHLIKSTVKLKALTLSGIFSPILGFFLITFKTLFLRASLSLLSRFCFQVKSNNFESKLCLVKHFSKSPMQWR